MTTIKAHFDGKAFIPDEPVDMPVNQRATVLVPQGDLQTPLTNEEFERLLEEMDRDAVTVQHSVDWSGED